MTDPAQYISGRTVEEQMNSLISYVDNRAEEVAEAAVADDVAACTQAVTDARDARDAAVAAKDTAVSTVSDCVKKTPASAQTITGYKLIVPAGVTADVTGDLTGNADTATTASKLGSSTVGGTLYPVFINGGTATVCNPMVDIATTQSISGQKIFTTNVYCSEADPMFIAKTSVDRATNPASNTEVSSFRTQDADNDIIGYTSVRKYADGSNRTYLGVIGIDGTETALHVRAESDGTVGVYSPTPTASHGSTAVTTIGYVSDTGGSLNNLVHTSGDESISGTKSMTSVRMAACGTHPTAVGYYRFMHFTPAAAGTYYITASFAFRGASAIALLTVTVDSNYTVTAITAAEMCKAGTVTDYVGAYSDGTNVYLCIRTPYVNRYIAVTVLGSHGLYGEIVTPTLYDNDSVTVGSDYQEVIL